MRTIRPSIAVLLFASGCSGIFIPVQPPASEAVQAADSGLADLGSGVDSGSGLPGDDGTDTGSTEGGSSDDSGLDTGEDTGDGSDTGEEPLPISPDAVPDFSLVDLNPNSSTFGQPVSPRDLLARTSGWYFVRAT
jgi:hypothetical protein